MADDWSPQEETVFDPEEDMETLPRTQSYAAGLDLEVKIDAPVEAPVRRGGSLLTLPATEFQLIGDADVVMDLEGNVLPEVTPIVPPLPNGFRTFLPQFPDQPGLQLGGVIPAALTERDIPTAIVGRPMGIDVLLGSESPTLEIPVLDPGHGPEETESTMVAWTTAFGSVSGDLALAVDELASAASTVAAVPAASGDGLIRDTNVVEEEAILAVNTPSGSTPTPQGVGSPVPREQPRDTPPPIPGAGRSGGGNTPPPKDKDRDRRRSRGWLIASHIAVAIIVWLLMRACAGVVEVTAEPQGNVVKPSNIFTLLREVRVKMPELENVKMTQEAQTSTTVQFGRPINLTVECAPMNNRPLIVWIIPGKEKTISSGTHPDLRKEVSPAPFVTIKTLPATCRNADGTSVDFKALKAEVAEDPDAQAYVEALAERCKPKSNRTEAPSTLRRDVVADTDANARTSVLVGCKWTARPRFVRSSPLALGWDAHVRAQGAAFGTWCSTCYDAARCAVECQKAGREAGLVYNEPASFGDECRVASRRKGSGK